MKIFSKQSACSPGSSRAEIAFSNVAQLQDMLDVSDVKKLSSVCSTLYAVVNDPYVWRKFMARDLHVSTCALSFPVDEFAKEEDDHSHKPYAEIYRGYRLVDGERGPLVAVSQRDATQKECARRAVTFLEDNFPGLRDAIGVRHALYAAAKSPRHQSVHNTVVAGAGLTGGSAGLSVGLGTSAAKAANLTAASAAKTIGVSKIVAIIGLKATKVLLVGAAGYMAAVSGFAALGLGTITYQQYQNLQAEWRMLERKINATKIQQHLAKMRVQADLERQMVSHPRAGLQEIRAERMEKNE